MSSDVAHPPISATQSRRARLRRGWQALHQATRRRAILVRSVTALARSRLDLLRRALYYWRVVAIEARTANARVAAGRPVLTVCFAGASRRLIQPAWESWCSAVKREREENEFAKQRAAWVAFAAAISRVANRKDRERQARAVIVWRLGVARSAVSSAQAQILEERNATRDAESAQVTLGRNAFAHQNIDVSSERIFLTNTPMYSGRSTSQLFLKAISYYCKPRDLEAFSTSLSACREQ